MTGFGIPSLGMRMWSIALLWEMAGGGIDGAHKAVQATAEHREPCDSRGSCTVLGAPGGKIPPGESTLASMGEPGSVR